MMRNLVLMMGVSLDGLVARPGRFGAGNWGGAAFAQSLSTPHLVDEYRLVQQPVALGDGLPLFAGLTAPLVLDLTEAQAFPSGEVLHVYRPAAG